MITTDETLLDRVKDMEAHEAWAVFYDLYWQPIVRYGCKLGLSEAHARDVLQDTMVTLMHVLPNFRYDRTRGRFRNFLLTIVHRKALGVMRRQARETKRNVQAGDTERAFVAGTEETKAERWRESVVESVFEELRRDGEIDQRTLAVFEAYAIQRRPGREVASEFGLTEDNVYQIKTRLLRRLRAAVRRRLRDAGTAEGV